MLGLPPSFGVKMPLSSNQLPEEVVGNVLNLLQLRLNSHAGSAERRWAEHMLGEACRHIEHFCTPLVSIAADQEWRARGGQGSLATEGYRKPSRWSAGRNLHFEHAVPVADLKKLLLNLKSEPDGPTAADVRRILQMSEIVWITRSEEEQLRRTLRGQPKQAGRLRGDWRSIYDQARIPCLP